MAMSSSNSNTGGYTARSARQTLNMNQPLPSPLSQPADPEQQQQQQPPPQASTSTLPQDPAAAAPKRRLRPSTSSSNPSTPKRLRPSGSGSGGGGGAGSAAKDYAPPTTRLADLGGVDACIEQMLELVALPLMHPEVYLHTGVRPPRGVLLVGPPGCGKTMLAGAIAGELALPFISISAPSIVSGMSGESEKTLRETFEEAAVRLLFLPLFCAYRSKKLTRTHLRSTETSALYPFH